MNAQRPKLQLHRFERVDASATNALLRVSGVWRAEPQLRLEPLALLVDDGRRTDRIAQLADPGSERAPLAARDAEQWRGTFPVLMALLDEPDITFAIDTGHGFVMLPLPVHVDRPGGPTLSGAPRQPTAPEEIRMLWQSARRLEQQVEALGEASSPTRSVAADARTRASRAARRIEQLEGELEEAAGRIAELEGERDGAVGRNSSSRPRANRGSRRPARPAAVVALTEDRAAGEAPFYAVVRIARQRWWVIVLCSVLAPTIAFLVTSQKPDRFEATAKLLLLSGELEQGVARVSPGAPVQGSGGLDPTSLDLVSLREIGERTAKALGGSITAEEVTGRVEIVPNSDSDVIRLRA